MNPELVKYLPFVSMALFGAVMASYNPKVKEYVDKAKTYVMSKVSRKKSSTSTEDSSPVESLSVHELLEELLVRAEAEQDSEGLMLLGAYGKHVYDLRLAPQPKSAAKKKGG